MSECGRFRFRFWPGGVFFGFRRFGLFGRSVLPVNRGPCLYIVRKKTPAYVTDVAIFYPGVLHLRENSLHLYGPSDDFDVLAVLKPRQTVRLTGYTPDQVWYRVQTDNGEMGFVRSEFLKKGIGRKIPDGSKVYTGPEIK